MAKKRAPVQDEEMTVGEMLRTPAEPRVEAGKMQEARSSFFSSMIAASTSSSTAPASGCEEEERFSITELCCV